MDINRSQIRLLIALSNKLTTETRYNHLGGLQAVGCLLTNLLTKAIHRSLTLFSNFRSVMSICVDAAMMCNYDDRRPSDVEILTEDSKSLQISSVCLVEDFLECAVDVR